MLETSSTDCPSALSYALVNLIGKLTWRGGLYIMEPTIGIVLYDK